MFDVQKLYGHWFCGVFFGTITSKGYFNCYHPSCPFAVKLVWPNNDNSRAVVEKVIFPFHCHEPNGNSRRTNRLLMEEEQRVIARSEDVGNAIAPKTQGLARKGRSRRKSKVEELV